MERLWRIFLLISGRLYVNYSWILELQQPTAAWYIIRLRYQENDWWRQVIYCTPVYQVFTEERRKIIVLLSVFIRQWWQTDMIMLWMMGVLVVQGWKRSFSRCGSSSTGRIPLRGALLLWALFCTWMNLEREICWSIFWCFAFICSGGYHKVRCPEGDRSRLPWSESVVCLRRHGRDRWRVKAEVPGLE